MVMSMFVVLLMLVMFDDDGDARRQEEATIRAQQTAMHWPTHVGAMRPGNVIPVAEPNKFVAAKKFSGKRDGMFFGRGVAGLGYYPDVGLPLCLEHLLMPQRIFEAFKAGLKSFLSSGPADQLADLPDGPRTHPRNTRRALRRNRRTGPLACSATL